MRTIKLRFVKRQVRKHPRRDGTVWVQEYWYYRRFGAPDDGKRLPGSPGSADFHAMLDTFNRRAGSQDPVSIQGTVAWLVMAYKSSPDFEGLGDKTRYEYERHLHRLTEALGHFEANAISRKAIYAIRDRMKETPSQANATMRVIALLFSWALDQEHVIRHPGLNLRFLKVSPRDQLWTREDEERFLKVATEPMRQALLFQLHTAQRQSDMRAFTWRKYVKGTVQVRQEKTNALVWVPATERLKALLDGMPRLSGKVFLDDEGRPWTEDRFGVRFREACTLAGLKNLQNRDLRRTACVRLAEAGATPHEIAAISGHEIHTVMAILETYTPRTAAMAASAIKKLNSAERRHKKERSLRAKESGGDTSPGQPEAAPDGEDGIPPPKASRAKPGPPTWKADARAAQELALAKTQADKDKRGGRGRDGQAS